MSEASQIKATKPVPARSMCSYPEAVFKFSKWWQADRSDQRSFTVAWALHIMFERPIETVQADLDRGHV